MLVTCEHGGCGVPAEYRSLFAGADTILGSHRGWDPGALTLARAVTGAAGSALVASETTRLLVDLNRSLHHRRLFSEFTRDLEPAARAELIARHYLPYRQQVEYFIADAVGQGMPVLHVSAHSFTPALDGFERNADVGLLFDPRRAAEARIAAVWRKALRDALPGWIVRRNYPYRGTADGLTSYLRKRFPDAAYAGFEIEVNQRRVAEAGWPDAAAAIAAALSAGRAEHCAGAAASSMMSCVRPAGR